MCTGTDERDEPGVLRQNTIEMESWQCVCVLRMCSSLRRAPCIPLGQILRPQATPFPSEMVSFGHLAHTPLHKSASKSASQKYLVKSLRLAWLCFGVGVMRHACNLAWILCVQATGSQVFAVFLVLGFAHGGCLVVQGPPGSPVLTKMFLSSFGPGWEAHPPVGYNKLQTVFVQYGQTCFIPSFVPHVQGRLFASPVW